MASTESPLTARDNHSPNLNLEDQGMQESNPPNRLESINHTTTVDEPATTFETPQTSTTEQTATPLPTQVKPSEHSEQQVAAPTVKSEEAMSPIGPSNENLNTVKTQSDPSDGPAVLITLLLTTGARHPYRIDNKYLRRRNVFTDEKADPFSISVYTMKELIWRDWREEWEQRPLSPSAIRLIHFGKLLDDKTSLKECRFQPEMPNVVHMTVKPQEAIDEEEAAAKMGKAGSSRLGLGDRERSTGCRCVIL